MKLWNIEARGEVLARRRQGGRLTAGLAVAVAVHLLPFSYLLYSKVQAPALPEAPVIAVEMLRLQAPPTRPSQQPPGPKQVKALPPKPQDLKPRVVDVIAPADVAAIPVQISPEPEPVKQEPAPETTAPPALPAPLSPRATHAPQDWQGRVLSHLNQHKRYPPAARARRQQGVPYVRFIMDRNGKVLSVQLEKSSGNADLDREAVALPKRAQPLPKPPQELQGDTIELITPVEFFMRR